MTSRQATRRKKPTCGKRRQIEGATFTSARNGGSPRPGGCVRDPPTVPVRNQLLKPVRDADVDVEVEREVPEAEDRVRLTDERKAVGEIVEDAAAGTDQDGPPLDGVDASLIHHRPAGSG